MWTPLPTGALPARGSTLSRTALPIALLLTSGAALAEPAEDVVVVGRPEAAHDAREDTPFAETLRPDDAPRTVLDLGDLLDGAPGASVRRTGGPGRAQTLQIRGAGAHQVAVFLDDVPVGGGRGGAVDLATLPVAAIDEATLTRGAAAASYGSGAQGGVLHLRTAPPPTGSRTRARLALASGRYSQIEASHAQGDARRDVLVVGAASAAAGDFGFVDVNGARRRRENADHQRGGGLVRGRTRVGATGALTGLVEGVAVARGEPGPEQFPRIETRSARQRVQAGLAWRDDGGRARGWAGEALLYGRLEGYRFIDPEPLFGGAPSDFRQRDTALGGRAVARHRFAHHTPQLAVEWRRDAATTRRDVDASRAEARLSAAAILSETWRPTPDWSVVGVLRLDDTDRRDALWVPKAGVAWRAARGLTLRANAGRLFRDPGFDELYFRGPGIAGDPTLRPESGWSADLGVGYARRRFEVELVGFVERYDRLILWVPLDAWRVQARDDAGARVRGAEARLGWGVGPAHFSASWTGLVANDDRAPHTPLPFRPRHRVNARGQWAAGGGLIYVENDWRAEAFADAHGRRTLPAYARLTLGVEGPLGDGFSASAEISNALDARALDFEQSPLPGRMFLATLRYAAAD